MSEFESVPKEALYWNDKSLATRMPNGFEELNFVQPYYVLKICNQKYVE